MTKYFRKDCADMRTKLLDTALDCEERANRGHDGVQREAELFDFARRCRLAAACFESPATEEETR